MSEAASDVDAAKNSSGCGCGVTLLVGLLLLFLFSISISPVGHGIKRTGRNVTMQQVRMIGQAFFTYSTDNTANGNAYPDGKSSTEIFQKLIDAGYISDPTILFVPLPGKIKPINILIRMRMEAFMYMNINMAQQYNQKKGIK